MKNKEKIKKETKIKIQSKNSKKKRNKKNFKSENSSSNESDIYFYNDIQRWKNNIKVPIWLKKPKDRESLDEFYKNIIRKLLRVKNKLRAYKIQEAYLIDCLQKCMIDLNLNSTKFPNIGNCELYKKLIYNSHPNNFSEHEKFSSNNQDNDVKNIKYFSNNKILDESNINCDGWNNFNIDEDKLLKVPHNSENDDINNNKCNKKNNNEINENNKNNSSNNNNYINYNIEITNNKTSNLNSCNTNNEDGHAYCNNYNDNNDSSDTKKCIKSITENNKSNFIDCVKDTLLKVDKKKKNDIIDEVFKKVIIPGAFFENNNFCPIFMNLLKLDIYNACCKRDVKFNSKLMDLFKVLNSFNENNVENNNKNKEEDDKVKKKTINDESCNNSYEEDLNFFKSQSSLYKLSQYCIEKNIIVNDEIISFDTIYIYNNKSDEEKSKNVKNCKHNSNITYRNFEYLLNNTKKKNPSLHYINNEYEILKKNEDKNITENKLKSYDLHKQSDKSSNQSNKNTKLSICLPNEDNKDEKKIVYNKNNSQGTAIDLNKIIDNKEFYEISSFSDENETCKEINTNNYEKIYENKNKCDKVYTYSKKICKIKEKLNKEHENYDETNNDLDIISEKSCDLLFSSINSMTDEIEYTQINSGKKNNIRVDRSLEIKDVNKKNGENILNKEKLEVIPDKTSKKLIDHSYYNFDETSIQKNNSEEEKSTNSRRNEIYELYNIDDQNYISKDNFSMNDQKNKEFSYQSFKLKSYINDKNGNVCKQKLDKHDNYHKSPDDNNVNAEILLAEEEIKKKKIINNKLKNYNYAVDNNIKNCYYRNDSNDIRTNENENYKNEMNKTDNSNNDDKSYCEKGEIDIDNINKNNHLNEKSSVISGEYTYNINSQNEDSRSFKTCEDSDNSIFISVKENRERNKESLLMNKKEDTSVYNKTLDCNNSLKSYLYEREEKNDNKSKKTISISNINFNNKDINEKSEDVNNYNSQYFLEESPNHEVIILDDDSSLNSARIEHNNNNENELKKENLKDNLISDKENYKMNSDIVTQNKERNEFDVSFSVENYNLSDEGRIRKNELKNTEYLEKKYNTDITFENSTKKNKKKENLTVLEKKEDELSILNINLNKANNVALEGLMEFFGLKSKRLSRKIIINELKKIQDYLNNEYDKLLKDKVEVVPSRDHVTSQKDSYIEDDLLTNNHSNKIISYNDDEKNNSKNVNANGTLENNKKRKLNSDESNFIDTNTYEYDNLLSRNKEKLQEDYINQMRSKIRKMELKALFERMDEAIKINVNLYKRINDEKKIEYGILKKYFIDCKLNVNKEILLSYAKDKNIEILLKKKKM